MLDACRLVYVEGGPGEINSTSVHTAIRQSKVLHLSEFLT